MADVSSSIPNPLSLVLLIYSSTDPPLDSHRLFDCRNKFTLPNQTKKQSTNNLSNLSSFFLASTLLCLPADPCHPISGGSGEMEGLLLPTDQQSMVSSFLEIAVGQTAETATLFLQVFPLPFLTFLTFLTFNITHGIA